MYIYVHVYYVHVRNWSFQCFIYIYISFQSNQISQILFSIPYFNINATRNADILDPSQKMKRDLHFFINLYNQIAEFLLKNRLV